MMWALSPFLFVVGLVVFLKPDICGGNCACTQRPLKTFNLQALLKCGSNSLAHSIWVVPGSAPYCLFDAVDQDKDANYMCYKFGGVGACTRTPYVYHNVGGSSNPNSLSRDLGGCSISKSLILDTDNCNYLVQAECYPNGTVHRYVTYKETWPRSARDAYIKAAKNYGQISFLANYSIDCEHENP